MQLIDQKNLLLKNFRKNFRVDRRFESQLLSLWSSSSCSFQPRHKYWNLFQTHAFGWEFFPMKFNSIFFCRHTHFNTADKHFVTATIPGSMLILYILSASRNHQIYFKLLQHSARWKFNKQWMWNSKPHVQSANSSGKPFSVP